MVGQDAVEERQSALRRQVRPGDELRPDREVAEHPALVAQLEARAVSELPRLAHVVEQRGGHQQVGIQARVKLAELADESADRHGVLEQPAEVGVMADARAGRASEVLRHRAAEQQALDRTAKRWVVDLPRQMFEETFELLRRPVGRRQELSRIERPRLETLDVVELGDHLAAKPLHAATYPHRAAPPEAKPDPVGLAEHARRKGAGAVPQLERQVRAPVSRGQPVLSQTAESAVEAMTRPQLRDGRDALGSGLGSGGLHASMVTPGPDTNPPDAMPRGSE